MEEQRDIVERLRKGALLSSGNIMPARLKMKEAADEIERLRAQLASARKAAIEVCAAKARAAIWDAPKVDGKYGIREPSRGELAAAAQSAIHALALTDDQRGE